MFYEFSQTPTIFITSTSIREKKKKTFHFDPFIFQGDTKETGIERKTPLIAFLGHESETTLKHTIKHGRKELRNL